MCPENSLLHVVEMALGGRQSDNISQLELLKLKLRKIVNCYEQVFNWSSKEIDTIGPRQTGHNSFSTSRGEEVGLYYWTVSPKLEDMTTVSTDLYE